MDGDALIKQVHSMDRKQMQAEIRAAYNKARFLEAALEMLDDDEGQERTATPPASPAANGVPSSKRKAVLRFLAENPERPVKQAKVKDALVERGWLDNTPAAAHSLGVTLSKMVKRGELERPEYAHYRITQKGLTT